MLAWHQPHLRHLPLLLELLEGVLDDVLHAGVTALEATQHVEHGVIGEAEGGQQGAGLALQCERAC